MFMSLSQRYANYLISFFIIKRTSFSVCIISYTVLKVKINKTSHGNKISESSKFGDQNPIIR